MIVFLVFETAYNLIAFIINMELQFYSNK